MPSFTDGRITESSGLAFSHTTADLLYTLNDEGTQPHVFGVNPSTGETSSTFSVKGATIRDPEAICVDAHGTLWYCDIGDNDNNRTDRAIYMRGEPGGGQNFGPLDFTRYRIAYPGGPRNAECFIINPVTDARYIISKAATGRLYQLPDNLLVGSVNTLTDTGINMPTNVSDGTFTIDGRYLLLTSAAATTTVYVYDGTTFASVGTITVPSQTKREGITMAADGLSFWVSSEGKNAPLYNVALPSTYQPLPPAAPGAPGGPPVNPCSEAQPVPPPEDTPPAETPVTGLDLTNWKLTLPTGSKGSPIEIKQPALATYRDERFFFFDPGYGTTFRCPGNGVTTKNSKNPRSELREMTNNGTKNASWSTTQGTHTLTITQKINVAPHDVVVGQIHDADDDVTVVRLIGGNALWATNGDDPTGTLMDGAYVLGTSFQTQFVVSGGQIETYYNGVLKQTLSVSTSGCYFKAGCYHQSNGSGSAYAEVQIASLTVAHS